MITTLLIIFCALLFVICGSVFQLSFIHLILLELTRIGLALLGLKRSLILQELNIFYLSSVLVFCLGLLFVYFYQRYGAYSSTITKLIFSRLNYGKRGLLRASGVFTVFIIYHYLVLGIPILNPDFDLRRFMVASSGLFGFPSRISIYGPAVIIFFSIAYFSSGWISGKKLIFISFINIFNFNI